MVAGIYASLASLRGWLITGNEAFKTERAALWNDIQKQGAELDRLSGQWVVEQNRVDWKQAKPLLDELRNAQDKAEAIAHTIDEQPAAKILATEAAPLVKLMLQKATSIIEEERAIASTDARKSLLITFADLRGSMAMAIGALRAYLLTADAAFKTEFAELWELNEKKFDALSKRRPEMTGDQQNAFDALVAARAKFSPLPQKMFDIRASDRWNMAQWFLTNEAAPRASKLLDIFAGAKNSAGSRSGGMVTRQHDSLKADGASVLAETNFLMTLLWVLMGVGIGVSVTVVYLTNRSIVPPILKMVSAMGQLAGGNHSVEIPATDKKDEIGLMARAVLIFKENMIKARELAAKEAEAVSARVARAARVNELTQTFDAGYIHRAEVGGVGLDRTAGDGVADDGDRRRNQQSGNSRCRGHGRGILKRANRRGSVGGIGRLRQRNQPAGDAIGRDRAEGRCGGRSHQYEGPGPIQGCGQHRRGRQAHQ